MYAKEKIVMKRIFQHVILGAILLAFLFSFHMLEADAASVKFTTSKYETFVMNSDSSKSYVTGVKIRNFKFSDTIESIQVSKKGIIKKIESDGWVEENGVLLKYITFKPVKAGTTNLTCTIKRGDSTYHVSCKIIVNKAVEPFYKILVNDKNVYKNGKQTEYFCKNKKNKTKIEVITNSGWKIKEIRYKTDTNKL